MRWPSGPPFSDTFVGDGEGFSVTLSGDAWRRSGGGSDRMVVILLIEAPSPRP